MIQVNESTRFKYSSVFILNWGKTNNPSTSDGNAPTNHPISFVMGCIGCISKSTSLDILFTILYILFDTLYNLFNTINYVSITRTILYTATNFNSLNDFFPTEKIISIHLMIFSLLLIFISLSFKPFYYSNSV